MTVYRNDREMERTKVPTKMLPRSYVLKNTHSFKINFFGIYPTSLQKKFLPSLREQIRGNRIEKDVMDNVNIMKKNNQKKKRVHRHGGHRLPCHW